MIALEDAREADKWTPELTPWLFNSKNGKPLAPSTIGKALRERLVAGIKGFDKLMKAVQARVKRGYVLGLDGRKVHIRSAHSALNTLFQSAGAIVMKHAVAVFFEKNMHLYGDFRFCANVHDEQQFEVRDVDNLPAIIGKAFADAIEEAGVRLKVRCPLSGSFDIGATWADTH